MASTHTSSHPRVARDVRAALFAASITLGACASLGAPGPVVADRPGSTDTPTALPAHAVQLEAGATDDRVGAQYGASRTEYLSLGEILLRFGLGANTEFRLFGNSYGTRTTDGSPTVGGMEDIKVGAKINLRAVPDSVHSWLPSAALLVATTLPTGATGIGAGAAQPEAKLAVNWTTPSPFSVYANLGSGAIETENGRATRAWASAAGWWALNPSVSLFVEGLGIGRLSGSGAGTSGNYVDGGFTYLVNERFQLDIRFGHGFGSETAQEGFIGAGFARRWRHGGVTPSLLAIAMRDRPLITISEKARTQAIASIRRYFDENMDEEIGDLKAALFLDYIIAEHGPAIYNQAIADARAFFEERAADLDGICYQSEFPFWARPKR